MSGGDLLQKRGLSLLFKKSEEIFSVELVVLEKALTLLDLRIGAFFGELSLLSFPTVIALVVECVIGFPLLDEDLKAATAISKFKVQTHFLNQSKRKKE